jgi:phenylalanyl-tRNA synthetase beta subunit
VADEPTRPIFNEFLKEDLLTNKRLFEVLGSKLKVPETKDQLSGLGFSDTKKDSLTVKVTGATQRILKITF